MGWLTKGRWFLYRVHMESSISLQQFVISLEMIVFNHVIFKVNFFIFNVVPKKLQQLNFTLCTLLWIWSLLFLFICNLIEFYLYGKCTRKWDSKTILGFITFFTLAVVLVVLVLVSLKLNLKKIPKHIQCSKEISVNNIYPTFLGWPTCAC